MYQYTILIIMAAYFLLLMGVSRLTSKGGSNEAFFRANGESPWWLVAIGMIGTSISGVTFVSVPGMPRSIDMTYMQMVLGFAVGYIIVAKLLLPLYYRLNLISIYKYLAERFGRRSYKTGAVFFIISKITGAAARLYLVVLILQRFVFDYWGVPFSVTALMVIALIWLYSKRSGIYTIVRTDALQTVVFISALAVIIYYATDRMGIDMGGAVKMITEDSHSRIFVFDDWMSKQNFFKQFLSGVFITIVMTGLDQDMMQKNLTIKRLDEAQKNMYVYGLAFIPVNLMFLALGVLLLCYADMFGITLPSNGDEILPILAESHMGSIAFYLFCIGITAAAFSSADSALTALTTSFCIDILETGRMEEKQGIRTRKAVHIGMSLAFVGIMIFIEQLNDSSIIDVIYTMAGYTYGPLLGLFAYGLFTKSVPRDKHVPHIAVCSPLISAAASFLTQHLWGYKMGYELLMLNAAITFAMLYASSYKRPKYIIGG